MKIDDSALFHGTYDPVKAREYYLRTRELKGRKPAAPRPSGGRPATTPAVRTGGKPNRSKTKSRQDELRAQKEALKKRLDRLQEVLRELVEAAQKRSGGDPNKRDEKDAKTSTDSKSKKDGSKDKPETAAEKKKRAKKAKEEYEKEHPNSLSTDVEILKEQVADIQAKIKKAMADAQAQRNKAGSNNGKSGSQNPQTSGPRGR